MKEFQSDWRDELKPHDIIKHKKTGKLRVIRAIRMSRMTPWRLVAVLVIKQKCLNPYMHTAFTHIDRCVLANYVKLQVRAKLNPDIDDDAKRVGKHKYSCTDLVGIP